MQELYGKRITSGLLSHIEERQIVFIEDGADIGRILEELECKEVGNPIPVPPLEASRPIKWKQYPKKAVIDVNKYIAKYDFEIARKIKGDKVEVLPYTEKQRVFHRFAVVELLFEVSRVLNGGQ